MSSRRNTPPKKHHNHFPMLRFPHLATHQRELIGGRACDTDKHCGHHEGKGQDKDILGTANYHCQVGPAPPAPSRSDDNGETKRQGECHSQPCIFTTSWPRRWKEAHLYFKWPERGEPEYTGPSNWWVKRSVDNNGKAVEEYLCRECSICKYKLSHNDIIAAFKREHPRVWYSYTNDIGSHYYHNTITNATQWEPPEDFGKNE